MSSRNYFTYRRHPSGYRGRSSSSTATSRVHPQGSFEPESQHHYGHSRIYNSTPTHENASHYSDSKSSRSVSPSTEFFDAYSRFHESSPGTASVYGPNSHDDEIGGSEENESTEAYENGYRAGYDKAVRENHPERPRAGETIGRHGRSCNDRNEPSSPFTRYSSHSTSLEDGFNRSGFHRSRGSRSGRYHDESSYQSQRTYGSPTGYMDHGFASQYPLHSRYGAWPYASYTTPRRSQTAFPDQIYHYSYGPARSRTQRVPKLARWVWGNNVVDAFRR